MILGLLRTPYGILALVAVLVGVLGVAVRQGYEWGATTEAARWQTDKIKAQAQAAQELQAARDAIAVLQAQREQNIQEGADAIERIRVVQLPGKVEIRRITVDRDRPVYRDCHADTRVLQLVNAARAGRPAAEAELRAADGGLPAGAAPGG